MLNLIFLLHTVVTVIVAFALLLFTKPFTLLVVDTLSPVHWPSGTIEDVVVAYARLAAVGLLMIGSVAHLARKSGHSAVRWVALTEMVVVGVLFMLVSFFLNVSPLAEWVFLINLVFVALYVWIAFFYRETV